MRGKMLKLHPDKRNSIQTIAISLHVPSSAKGIAWQKHPHEHQQPSPDSMHEQMKNDIHQTTQAIDSCSSQ